MAKPHVVAVARSRPLIARILQLLEEDGFEITVTRTEDEALEHVRSSVVVLLDCPDAACCPDGLCGWIVREIRPVPPVVAMVDWGSREPRARCDRCYAVYTRADQPEAVARAVRSAAVWWPGDV